MKPVKKVAGATFGSIVGRKGLPRSWVARMHQDYLRLCSIEKTAVLHGRTRQCLWEIFRRHGFERFPKSFHEPVLYRGRKYTPGKNGYLRATGGDRRPLHYVVWEDHKGPVPAGHELTFLDGDVQNCALDNLLLLDKRAMRQRNASGNNQFTLSAGARLKILTSNFNGGHHSLAAAAASKR